MIKLKALFATAVCWAVLLVSMPALSAEALGTGTFPDTGLIEQHLKRGVSTKADVQRLLGIPNGTGNLSTPPGVLGTEQLGGGPREIWYYDDVEITNFKSDGGVMTMDMRQQILLVYFKGEFFDGYFWTSNLFAPTAE